MKSIFIGFDFSMNKPAATVLYDKKFYHFIWPCYLANKQIQKYQDCGVFVRSRNIGTVSTNDKNSQIVLEHTKRSTELANIILSDLDDFIDNIIKADKDTPIYISSEGLSYASTGSAILNLATYKGVLLSKLYEHYYGRLYGLYTYSPIAIKSIAGCAGKNKVASKTPMIDMFKKQKVDNDFHKGLVNGYLINKTSYLKCVDDIVDSYWAVVTMLKKEGFVK